MDLTPDPGIILTRWVSHTNVYYSHKQQTGLRGTKQDFIVSLIAIV